MGNGVRFLGTMTHSNIFSECILFSLPFVLIALSKTAWPIKIVPHLAFFLSICMIVIAQTRAVWVGMFTGIGTVIFFLFKNNAIKPLLLKYKYHYLTLTALTFTISLIICILFKSELSDIYNHLISLLNLDSNSRIDLWKKTILIIQKHFFIGVGPGNWRFYVPVLDNVATQQPHNDYLWVFAESGIITFFVFLSIFIYTIMKIIYNLNSPDKHLSKIFYFLLFGIIAYCTDAFFAFPKERPYLLLLSALMFSFVFSNSCDKILFTFNYRFICISAFLICSYSMWFSWNRMNSEMTHKKIVEHANLNPVAKKELLQSINPFFYSVDPFSNPIKTLEGEIQFDLGNIYLSKKCYLEANAIAPLHPEILINLGSICELSGERADARKYYNEAISIEPLNNQALLNLAVIEFKDNNENRVRELLNNVDTTEITHQGFKDQYSILKSALK
jgi:hypothetical protein